MGMTTVLTLLDMRQTESGRRKASKAGDRLFGRILSAVRGVIRKMFPDVYKRQHLCHGLYGFVQGRGVFAYIFPVLGEPEGHYPGGRERETDGQGEELQWE